jgi:hypothetical protein
MNRLEYQHVMFNSEIPFAERLLYAYLRSCADYKTGIVGERQHKRISYQAIREALEYRPERGSHGTGEAFDRNRIFKLLRSLERRGVVVSLAPNAAASGRRGTPRKFLPLCVGAAIRPQEEGDKEGDNFADDEGDTSKPVRKRKKSLHLKVVSIGGGHPLSPDEGDNEGDSFGDDEGDTSVIYNSLSLTKYTYYAPDENDYAWLRYQFGADHSLDDALETEKFNLRNARHADYDHMHQREDWRGWMIRAYEYAQRRL